MSVRPFFQFSQLAVAIPFQKRCFQTQHHTFCKSSITDKSSESKHEQFYPGRIYGGLQNKIALATGTKAYCSCAKKVKKGFDINNKIALVTGGANGIGLNYVQELLSNGAKGVTIADMDECGGEEVVEELIADYGEKVNFIKTDVTKTKDLEAAFKKVTSSWKGLDIVINNAGILNDKQWELQIAINCNHVARGCLLGIKHMGKNNGKKGGVIVNIASILGISIIPGCPIYNGTKHFVVGLTRSFGTPFWYDITGITFLTMCPGVTDTPLISEAGNYALEGFDESVSAELVAGLGGLPAQPTENVAKGMMKLIKKGKNGSIWVAEGNEPIYEVEIPDRLTMRKN